MQSRENLSKSIDDVVSELPPKQRKIYEDALAASRKRRLILTCGYAAVALVVFVGVLAAFYHYGNHLEPKNLWYFCIPFFSAGSILLAVSKAAKKYED